MKKLFNTTDNYSKYKKDVEKLINSTNLEDDLEKMLKGKHAIVVYIYGQILDELGYDELRDVFINKASMMGYKIHPGINYADSIKENINYGMDYDNLSNLYKSYRLSRFNDDRLREDVAEFISSLGIEFDELLVNNIISKLENDEDMTMVNDEDMTLVEKGIILKYEDGTVAELEVDSFINDDDLKQKFKPGKKVNFGTPNGELLKIEDVKIVNETKLHITNLNHENHVQKFLYNPANLVNIYNNKEKEKPEYQTTTIKYLIESDIELSSIYKEIMTGDIDVDYKAIYDIVKNNEVFMSKYNNIAKWHKSLYESVVADSLIKTEIHSLLEYSRLTLNEDDREEIINSIDNIVETAKDEFKYSVTTLNKHDRSEFINKISNVNIYELYFKLLRLNYSDMNNIIKDDVKESLDIESDKLAETVIDMMKYVYNLVEESNLSKSDYGDTILYYITMTIVLQNLVD